MANAIIDTLKTKDESGEEYLLYPRSKTTAIISEDGKNLDTILSDFDERITQGSKTTTIVDEDGNDLDAILADFDKRITESEYNEVYGETFVSMGRKDDTTVGNHSVAVGDNNEASGENSIAIGKDNTASNSESIALGTNTKSQGVASLSIGTNTVASGDFSLAGGDSCETKGEKSVAFGDNTISSGDSQYVHGKYNVEDTENKYAHIVGGGTSEEQRKNIHTLDWEGNAVFAGEVTNGNGATLNGIESTTKTSVVSNIESLISIKSIKGTIHQDTNTKALQYPLFTTISINSDSESCSALSPTQIALCGMNDVYDIIEANNLTRVYELIKKYEIVNLNGTENITLNNTTGSFIYSPTVSAKIGSTNIVSDNYEYFEENTYETNYGIFILETGEIGIKHDGFTTIDEYKDWLANNNVTIIYERATEEVIDLDESFVSEIKNLKLFVGENTIMTNSTTIQPIIEFDYATSRMAKYVLEAPMSTSNAGGGDGNVNVPTKISQLRNDVGYITIDDVPKKVSELNNDAGYLTLDTLPNIPSSGDTSNAVPLTRKIANIDLVDDITTDELKEALSVPSKLSDLDNDVDYVTKEEIGNIELDIIVPTTRTIAGIDLVDNITKEELKEALELGEGGNVDSEIPTKVSQLENDKGYITQDDVSNNTKVVDIENRLSTIETNYTSLSSILNTETF